MLGIQIDDSNIKEFLPILVHLITSTDECTIFMSNSIIGKKAKWYIVGRPTDDEQPNVDSGSRDAFTTDMTGDAHLRGVRMVLNNTFTAGGRVAPVFACVYGCTSEEMPFDEIVVKPIKGLVAASESNGSTEEGFVVFIRGKYKTPEEIEREVMERREDLSIISQPITPTTTSPMITVTQ